MIAYNGGSISSFLKNANEPGMYVTDTFLRAVRYANAQATGIVREELGQELAEGTVVFEIECEPQWLRRSDDHHTLDVCEAYVREFRIVKATIRFHNHTPTTVYGTRHTGYKRAEQVLAMMRERGIEVVEADQSRNQVTRKREMAMATYKSDIPGSARRIERGEEWDWILRHRVEASRHRNEPHRFEEYDALYLDEASGSLWGVYGTDEAYASLVADSEFLAEHEWDSWLPPEDWPFGPARQQAADE